MGDENDSKTIISESTPVRIGLMIGFLTVFGTSIWWASSVNSKLDSILSSQTTATTSIAELKSKDLSLDKEISDLKLNIALMKVNVDKQNNDSK